MKGAYAPHEILRDETGVQTDVERGAADKNRDAPGLNRHRARHRTGRQFGATNRQGRADQIGDRGRSGVDSADKTIVGSHRAGKCRTTH